RRETEAVARGLEQSSSGRSDVAEAPHVTAGNVRVERDRSRTEADLLARARRLDAATDGGRRLAVTRLSAQPRDRDAWHVDVQIDAIEERPRHAGAIPIDHRRRAATGIGSIAEPPAGTGVHRGDELEGGGEDDRPRPPRDGDPALLERLPEWLEDVP